MPIGVIVVRAEDLHLLARVAEGVFDDPLDARATGAFLADSRHHLVVAIEDEQVVGFVSAVHYEHPDKSTPELWINEVGVADQCRGRGIARDMLRAMLATGTTLGCTEAWVLTDKDNTAARKLYAAMDGAHVTTDLVMYSFPLCSTTLSAIA